MSDQVSNPSNEEVPAGDVTPGIVPKETQVGATVEPVVASPDAGVGDSGVPNAWELEKVEMQRKHEADIAGISQTYDTRDANSRKKLEAMQQEILSLQPPEKRADYQKQIQTSREDELRAENDDLQNQIQDQEDVQNWIAYYAREMDLDVRGNTSQEVNADAHRQIAERLKAQDPTTPAPDPKKPVTPPTVLTQQGGNNVVSNPYLEMKEKYGTLKNFRAKVRQGLVPDEDLLKFNTDPVE